MNARFPHSSAAHATAAPARIPGDDLLGQPGRGAALADHACCCAAKAAVQVIMPPTAARPRQTELLMCGHHYRIARRVLLASGATVHPLPGTASEIISWAGIEASPAA